MSYVARQSRAPVANSCVDARQLPLRSFSESSADELRRHSVEPYPSTDGAQSATASEIWLAAEALRDDFHRFVFRRLRDCCAVEDVLQCFYVRVFENADNLKDARTVRAWLYRLLRSSLVDYARSELRQRDIAARLGSMASSLAGEKPFSDLTVAEMLEELRPEYRDVLVRMQLRGDTTEEAATDLRTTQNNIRVRHFRARAALRSAYGRLNPHERSRARSVQFST